MPDEHDLADLPVYLRRHLSTRYALTALNYLPSEEDRSSYLKYALQDRHENGLRYLGATLEEVGFSCKGTHELICELDTLPSDGTAPVIISELIQRLDELDRGLQKDLAASLTHMASEVQKETPKRIVADRALMRLLFRLDFPEAFAAAAACARSKRTTRREAGYRFYLVAGIDEAGREVLTEQIWDDSTRYCRAITKDDAIVRRLTLPRVLELAPSSYWRMLAIAGRMESGNFSEVIDVCADYPLELVWAINVKRETKMLPQMLKLLEQYKDDPYVLNRILQCLARLGDSDSLALGIQRATELLSSAEY